MTTEIFVASHYFTTEYASLERGDWFMTPSGDICIKISHSEALDLRSGCFISMALPPKVLRITEVNITIKTES